MILSEADAKLFFELWLGLLDYVNKKYHMNPQLPEISPKISLPINQIMKVSDWLWEHPDEIDSYLSENNHLIIEHQEIVRGWKSFVRGSFIVERHLRKGSISISTSAPTAEAFSVDLLPKRTMKEKQNNERRTD